MTKDRLPVMDLDPECAKHLRYRLDPNCWDGDKPFGLHWTTRLSRKQGFEPERTHTPIIGFASADPEPLREWVEQRGGTKHSEDYEVRYEGRLLLSGVLDRESRLWVPAAVGVLR